MGACPQKVLREPNMSANIKLELESTGFWVFLNSALVTTILIVSFQSTPQLTRISTSSFLMVTFELPVTFNPPNLCFLTGFSLFSQHRG